MRRREFIALLGGTAIAWPVRAIAQATEKLRRIGVLMGITAIDPDAQPRVATFQKQLQELGWSEQNIRIDYRWVSDDAERLLADVRDLVRLAPDLLVADTTAALTALRPEAREIPVVFLRVSDPVGAGFIGSLARPGGNITGITNFEFPMGGKWLELLKEIAPRTVRITVLLHPAMTAHAGLWQTIETAAPTFSVEARQVPVRDSVELQPAIVLTASEPNSGVIVLPDALVEINRGLIIELAMRHHLPVIYPLRHYAAAGGLIAYGPEALDLYRQAAVSVDRILRGASPADLPIQHPRKFELAINLKTAKALGLTVPPSVLARADEVIE